MEKQIEEMARIIRDTWLPLMEGPNTVGEVHIGSKDADRIASNLYDAGYRKQTEEELIDKIATYFEKAENWHEIKYGIWLTCGRSHDLRRMLRESLRD